MVELASLSESDRHLALQRFHLLQPHLEQGVALTSVAAGAGLSYRTAKRWVSLYRRFGLAGLSRKERADHRERRSLSSQLKEVVEGLALQKPPLSISSLYRTVSRIAQEQNERIPSYAVVYDIVRQLPTDLVTLAHEGSKSYNDSFELVHRREAVGPNAIWQADHTLLDILVVREDGPAGKPWLTIIIDDYSRAIAGYFLSFEAPCAIQTALALHQAIWRKNDSRWLVCGIPEVLYTDNGSDFRSQHLEQVAADLKIQLIFSTPGKPRGRGRVERFFATLTPMFLADLPGHTPAHGGICGQPVVTLAGMDIRLRDFILNIYHQRQHSETKMTPKERWECGGPANGGFLPQMPESLEHLDLLLLTVAKTRKVHVDGIRFQGLRYVDKTLAAYVGESVLLRYDPRDMAEIRLFYNGRFLCRAICPELAGETVPLRDVLRARNQRRRELRTVLWNRKKTVDALLEMKGGVETAAAEEMRAKGKMVETVSEASTPRLLKRYFNE
jgi:putative transposase